MTSKKRPQKVQADTKAYFVTGDSSHNRFEDLARKLVSVPKKGVDEQAETYEQEKSQGSE